MSQPNTGLTLYVLGFLFSEDKENVALILKNRPDWQKGLLNGIGGKIEENETPTEAMVREFKEESGVLIDNWNQFLTMSGYNWEVYCFKCFSDDVFNVSTKTDETVIIFPVSRIGNIEAISNLQWLIPMCLDCNDDFKSIIKYKS